MPNCYKKIITISPKLAMLASGQFFLDDTHRRKGKQHTWQISSCHVINNHFTKYYHFAYAMAYKIHACLILIWEPKETHIGIVVRVVAANCPGLAIKSS